MCADMLWHISSSSRRLKNDKAIKNCSLILIPLVTFRWPKPPDPLIGDYALGPQFPVWDHTQCAHSGFQFSEVGWSGTCVYNHITFFMICCHIICVRRFSSFYFTRVLLLVDGSSNNCNNSVSHS